MNIEIKIENLRKKLEEIMKKADYIVTCRNKQCELFNCIENSDCKLLQLIDNAFQECNKLVKKFTEENGLEFIENDDSEAWTPCQGMGFRHTRFSLCLGAVKIGGRIIHFHAEGQEGHVFNSYYSNVEQVKIYED
ncbi:MAG: hypothetical protein ABIL37_01230 [candidate division WOR-3 bacterium]